MDQSMGSSASGLRLLPEELHDWVPKDILSAVPNRTLLFRKYGITELHWASLTGSIADAGDLLNRGADVHKTTLRKWWWSARTTNEIQHVTPLFLAARSGHVALVRVLLEHGAVDDILKASTRGDTALHAAALSGDVNVMKLLLAAMPRGNGAVDKKGYNARIPLHYAAGGGHRAIVDALLKSGADVFARDKYGATPFHFAAGWGNSIPCMDLLMDSRRLKQNVNETDAKGWTALHYASVNGQMRTVEWLLDQGAFINAVDPLHGNTPLHLAARHPDVIYALTASGANIWLTNKKGEHAIGLAHNHKDALAMKAIIKAIQMEMRIEEVDAFAKIDKGGGTLLHYVSAYGTAEDIDSIVGLSAFQAERITPVTPTGSLINVTDDAGSTAMHWAAITGNVDAPRILAKHSADLNEADGEGRSILCLAIVYGNADMAFARAFIALPQVKFQIEKWVSHREASKWMKEYYIIHNLQQSIKSKLKKLPETRAIVQRFITESLSHVLATRKAGADNILDDLPPIYLALNAKREDIASFMQEHLKGLEWDSDTAVNIRSEETQRTALHWATILGESEMVSKLCTSPLFSEDLNAYMEDKYGKTPLQYAQEMNRIAIEKQLMERKDVKDHLESLYRDRQVYVDATNAVLVEAALIASVTFAGWLQPPLNYVAYYDMPISGAPDGTYAQYVAVKQDVGVRVFWGFNSLSFMFAIATLLAGLLGMVAKPSCRVYIGTTVVNLRRRLRMASAMLALSIVFVLGAFAAAGFSVLPPILKYQLGMWGLIVLGGIPCSLLLAKFVGIPRVLRPAPLVLPLSPLSPPPPPPPAPVPALRIAPSRSRPWESTRL